MAWNAEECLLFARHMNTLHRKNEMGIFQRKGANERMRHEIDVGEREIKSNGKDGTSSKSTDA